jgi:hypothetical protein
MIMDDMRWFDGKDVYLWKKNDFQAGYISCWVIDD